MSKRMTEQKKIIQEELLKMRTHPTAEILYENVKKRFPCISPATIYRNLDIMVRNSQIRKLQLKDETRRRFDGDLSKHYHIRCKTCGSVDDLFVEIDPLQCVSSFDLKGYLVEGFDLEFYGICDLCKRKGGKK